ncbi:CDP-glycerol--glycerophosphate glycerophosphotransferase [Pediococcus acidilactici]|uniref:CDP-glycerol glycerophosphotransferase family protein n=1 Tax=Pediococcus acidilactici TaxID=1254 RepID=UPI0013278265|nr:CDP-glycerol glycerophosphotransferase family protein [Pediococcus acidilactici]KAF0369892.1 CDP-glycerol--glycerophosphate glycerophosphotransferase [Pediococcus acidilactici]KAF0388534.1 CDP-glycerol--glycerophosphate glycerophosphotransferase [Pediococcus acidilactici]
MIRTLIKKVAISVLYPIFSAFPIKKDRIFINSNNGKVFSGNAKAIFEYLQEYKPGDYNFIIVSNKKSLFKDVNVKIVKYMSLKYLFYICTSKYWIADINMYSGIKKRPGQIYLQTWHGTPLKKIGNDIIDNSRQSEKREWARDAQQWDYFISNGNISDKNYYSAFQLTNTKILDYGLPRNDKLEHSVERSKKFRSQYNVGDRKIILYAPTYRDDGSAINFDFNEFAKKLGHEYFIIVNFHRLYSNSDISGNKDVYVNTTMTIEECMSISDILITDYSSVFFDFSMLSKPMIFYAYDFDKYMNKNRGMYYNYKDFVPGTVCMSFLDLLNVLSKKSYKKFIKDFAEEYNQNFYTRDATKRVVNTVFKGE